MSKKKSFEISTPLPRVRKISLERSIGDLAYETHYLKTWKIYAPGIIVEPTVKNLIHDFILVKRAFTLDEFIKSSGTQATKQYKDELIYSTRFLQIDERDNKLSTHYISIVVLREWFSYLTSRLRNFCIEELTSER